MKKIKTVFISLTSASVIALSILPVSAADMTKITDTEAKQITSAAKADEFTAMTVKKFNTDDAYRIYWLDYFMIENYKKSHDFKSLITDEERIMLPAVNNRESFFKDCDGALICFKKVNGVYEWNGQKNGDNIINFNSVTKELVNSIDEEIVNIIHTYSDRYYADIIYIETAENEYAVPYFAGMYPNTSRWLSNGKIYTVSDFMDRLDHAYNDEYNYGTLIADNGIVLDGSMYLTDDIKLSLGILESCSDDDTRPETRTAENFKSFARIYALPLSSAFGGYDNIMDILKSDLPIDMYYIVEHKDGSRSYFDSEYKEMISDRYTETYGKKAPLPPIELSEKAYSFLNDTQLIKSRLPESTRIIGTYYLSGESYDMGTSVYYETDKGDYVYYCGSGTDEMFMTVKEFCEYQRSETEKLSEHNTFIPNEVSVRTQNTEQTAGDINGDGTIDIYDAIEIAKSLIGARTFTEEEIRYADINGDGKVDLYDAIGIAEYMIEHGTGMLNY